MNLFDDVGFDDPTVLLIEERQQEPLYGGSARSTKQTRKRYAFLRTRRVGDTWQDGRHIYRCGPGGMTVYDTGQWS